MELEIDKQSRCSDFFQNQVVARGKNVVALPLHFLQNVGQLIYGSCLAIGSALILGTDNGNFNHAIDLLGCKGGMEEGGIIADIFKDVLCIINPNATFVDDFSLSYLRSPLSIIQRGNELGGQEWMPMKEIFNEKILARKSKFHAHVTNRLMALGALIRIVFCRAVDALACLFAVPAAILTLGKFKKVNSVAYSTLHFPVILADVFFFAMKVINPWAGINESFKNLVKCEKMLVQSENEDNDKKIGPDNHHDHVFVDNNNGEDQVNVDNRTPEDKKSFNKVFDII